MEKGFGRCIVPAEALFFVNNKKDGKQDEFLLDGSKS
jgi:hypothetical protein